MGTLNCGHFFFIYRHLVCELCIKTIITIFISIDLIGGTNVHRPYRCDHISLYMILVNNSIDLITPYW